MNTSRRLTLGAATIALAATALGGGPALAAADDTSATGSRIVAHDDRAQLRTTGEETKGDVSAAVPAVLQKGDKGHGVWCVQVAVNSVYRSWYNSSKNVLTEDGVFGQSTHDWVAWYQGIRNLKADGIVGKNTGDKVIGDAFGKNGVDYRNYCRSYVPHH
ncbi:hypothetical protein CLM62_07915 [Streptomyces sp. SA15]|uniref:peptidoglycan-binding domain-containing protein n=1 Tax=Streptomyces sp. SA15 TaxID=934019 RepID=UPI000BAF9D74|nr:peptidoglycan-binding domain-containing protein [Streptomyces sp. SA15]PAZ16484.1 hypothetical protein CLM62_07915 [Streptomyces sp. SA15]